MQICEEGRDFIMCLRLHTIWFDECKQTKNAQGNFKFIKNITIGWLNTQLNGNVNESNIKLLLEIMLELYLH